MRIILDDGVPKEVARSLAGHDVQPLHRRSFAILVLSTNHWDTLEPNVLAITEARNEAKPGIVTEVDCGKFVPRKFRKRPPGA